MFILRSPLPVTPPEPYVGPGDVVSGASAFWGLRAYSLATVGDDVVRLRRDSDNAEQDFATITGGGLDTAAISAFAGGANLFIVTLFDQTGNGHDATQATAGNQLVYNPTGIGSLPVWVSTVATRKLATAGGVSVPQPFTVAVLGFASVAGQHLWAQSNTNSLQWGTHASAAANIWFAYDGNVISAAAADSVWHTGHFISISGSGDGIYIDGSLTSADNSDGAMAGVFEIGAEAGSTAELGIWPIAFSGGQATAMDANQAAYWGY